MSPKHKLVAWLSGEIKTPPFSSEARVQAGFLLRQLQAGQNLAMPHSRPMPSIGPRCHELRIQDRNRTWRVVYRNRTWRVVYRNRTWRVVYRIDADAIVIAEVFAKKTQATPKTFIQHCQERLQRYDEASRGED